MKVGLIGAGLWGQKILEELLHMGLAPAVVDVCPVRRSELPDGVEAYDSLADVPDVDGWIVATPASTHREVVSALDGIGNQRPIFCEKPLATSQADARWFAQRQGAPLHVMHIWTFHPAIRKVASLYREGRVGELTMIRSRRMNWTSPRQDVDALFNLAPHDLSIFQYLLGEMPTPIHASGEWIDGHMVGCLVELEAQTGVQCVFEVSNRYGEKVRELRMHGTEGVLVLPDDTGNPIQLVSGSGHVLPDHIDTYDYENHSALSRELKAFLDYLGTGDDSELPSCRAGAEIVFVLERIKVMLHRKKR